MGAPAKSPRGGTLVTRETAAVQSPRGGVLVSGNQKTTKKKGGRGVTGFFSHLGSDIGNAATGLATGLVTAGESLGGDVYHHPLDFAYPPAAAKFLATGDSRTRKKIVAPVVASYKQTYGPLTRGDFNTFFSQLYAHPLGPILDVATVLTGGAGGVAKAGSALSKAGLVSETGRLAKLGELGSIELTAPHGGDTILKATSRNPLVKGRKTAVDSLFKKLDSLYGGTLGQMGKLPADIPLVSESARYGRATRRLSERQALSNQLLDKPYKKIRLNKREMLAVNLYGPGVHPRDLARLPQFTQDPRWAKILNDPKLHQLVDNPTPKLRRAIDEARVLSGHGEQLAKDIGFLGDKAASGRLTLGIRRVEEQLGETVTPLPGERFYVKDVAATDAGYVNLQAVRGGGKSVQRSYIHENKNTYFNMGRLALGQDILGPEFSRRVKVALYTDLHKKLTDAGALLDEGLPLPKGYEYQRRKVRDIVGEKTVSAEPDPQQLLIPETTGATKQVKTKYTIPVKHGPGRPERIPKHVQQSAAYHKAMDELVPDPHDMHTSVLGEGFSTRDAAQAEKVGKQYVIVPSSLVKAVTGEFHRSSRVIRVIDKPLKLWRAMVLGGRVGFFTNNVVGNALLYAVHNAGPQGLAAMFRHTLTADEMRRYFPEQVAGTFGGTQKVGGAIGRATRKVGAGIMPATQAVSETYMRRSAVEAALRKNPDIKRVYRQMPRQTRDFHAAILKTLDEKPLVVQEVTNKVNAALGDYLSLSNFERTVVRQLIPFYAWYRAILTITLKLAVDNPARANLLTKIGQVGAELTQDKIGPTEKFLRGAYPVGDPRNGLQRILTTQGINPYATVPQEAGAAGALIGLGGDDTRRELLGMVNPFLAGPLNAGQPAFGGPAARGGFLGGMLLPVATNLPLKTLIERGILDRQPSGHGKPTRYKYSQQAAILSFLGVPLKDLNLAVEHEKAKKK